MKVFRSISEVDLHSTSIAIGVFDGVHRGHQQVLAQTRAAAQNIPGGTSLVITFDRHPAELIAPRRSPMYLSSLSQRLEIMDSVCGVDAVLVIPFNLQFANVTAQEFVRDILAARCGAKRIFVGADFRYGQDRAGGVMDLEAAGDRYGFGVDVIHSVSELGERISSTGIRKLVAAGDMRRAKQLLGRPFVLRGHVVRGKQLGRELGYPTANLQPEQYRQILPSAGVYAGWVTLSDGSDYGVRHPAAVSIGSNPTTDIGNDQTKVECHLLGGFNADIYGEMIDVELCEHIRPQAKFDSLTALVKQIDDDVAKIEMLLASHSAGGVDTAGLSKFDKDQ